LCRQLTEKLAKALSEKRIEQKQHISEFLAQLMFLSNSYNTSRRKHTDQVYQDIVVALKPMPKPANDKKIEKLIERKRAKYEALADAGRELIITSPGVFIGKTQKGITVKDRGVKKMDHPLHNLKHIIIMSQGTTLSSNVIQYCAVNKIPIDFLGFDGLPFAKLFAPVYPDGNLGLAQHEALANGKGVELMKGIIIGKMKNQLGLIKYYYKYRKDTDSEYAGLFEHHVAEMVKIIAKVELATETNVEPIRQVLMGYEGHASTFYWDMMIKHLNEYVVFEKREHQGASDLVNSMLNYGYAILYSRVWEAVIRARLNPHISYLHAPQTGKPTLAFDLIEEFRQQTVDKVVFALISRGEEMKVVKGLLTSETKTRLAAKVIERLNRKENFRGKPMRLIEIIHLQARNVAAYIEKNTKYKPYVAKW
jgi:CRISPR-associated endonuclease Cas1